MIFSNKSLLLLCCGLIIGSAFGLHSVSTNVAVSPAEAPQKATPADTATTQSHFKVKKIKQDTYDDISTSYPMDAPKPENIKSVIEYDVQSGTYVFRTKMGDQEISTPFVMSSDEYMNYTAKQDMIRYWKEKNAKREVNNEDKFKSTDLKFNIGPADKVFGPGGVQIKTQGSAELIMGYKTNKIDNPTLTERMRKTGTFNFDEKIQLNVNGTVGDKMNIGLNYNTESSFDFDQKMVKLAYKGKEDDIIKSIEAGNVSMQLNSSLITGSTALFGIKTDLQFGRLSVSSVISQQQSQSQTVSSKGSAQTTSFDISADNYDDNRHYFLSQYFRDNFESGMSKLPVVSSAVTIKNIEVWVTNKKASYDNARNIVGFMDLGETDKIDNNYWSSASTLKIPYNRANNLYETMLGLGDAIRNVETTNDAIAGLNIPNFTGGEDYEKIESARKLESTEYTLNSTLGFISLRTALNADEVLAVAYTYSYGGQDYEVGELSSSTITSPKTLIVKLLKSSGEAPGMKTWDLMMKNVYDLGALDVQKDNFKLNVVYRNDSVGTELQYLSEGEKTTNKLLLRVMNLDRLDTRSNANPDGKFDYVSGYTILPTTGRVIFPVLEPFGEHLGKQIDSNYDKKNPSNSKLASKYVFQELYDSTQIVAQSSSDKNKFRITGSYKASSSSEIRLNATNIPRGSVTVTAGGTTLVENVDYTVDYTMGTVTILNQTLIDAGTKINVQLENQSTFNLQRKTMLGTHLEYKFNKDFTLGGTLMHLSETPLTSKVSLGNEPISNTIWGMNTSWKTESQWLTNMVDKLPFVNATQPSTIAVNAEFAQLVPGHSSVVGKNGYSYIDDFESTSTSIDIHYPINWFLASTPYNPSGGLFPEASLSNDVAYGKNRALLSWYYVDPLFNGTGSTCPDYIRNDDNAKSNHLTRYVLEQEIFPNKQTSVTQSPRLTVMNLSYYPTERGPYNLDVDGLNADGTLNNPKKRWGGIMRKLDVTDFETANIEYIDFWMMDPFINDTGNTHTGGAMYFNLGDVSEDILKDGKKSFEQGLPSDGDTLSLKTTVWGHVSKTQSTVTAFSGTRANQDVGLDGLSTTNEKTFGTYKNYVEAVKKKVTDATAVQEMESDQFSPINDPAGDNFHYFRGTDYDKEKLDIISRYKHFNGTDGNSQDASQNTESYSTSATSLPDQEDINSDNTLNEYEKYFQYRIGLKRDSMVVGSNYITDIQTSTVKLANSTSSQVKWYHFKIPLSEWSGRVGSIRNFKSIRFIRMFLTEFEQPITLRLGTLDLVRGDWRTYTKDLYTSDKLPTTDGEIAVQAVNIEENNSKSPVNYVLPPGVSRQTDPSQPTLLELNEQAMMMKVTNLSSGDARAVYKATSYDLRHYKKLQMFVHAEKLSDDVTALKNNELTCFIRLGSDMKNNYYEYEVPLQLTPAGSYSNNSTAEREKVWIPDNMFDFSFDKLTKAKQKRNIEKQNSGSLVTNITPYSVYDSDNSSNKITVLGNPSISDVEYIMIGVRNKASNPKSAEVWVNELRMSGFDESGGWAAMGNVAVGVSDIGTVNVAGRIEKAGYGGLESNVNTRRSDNLYQVNFSTAFELGRFLPEQAKLHIPVYYAYSNETLRPKYNPLDEDILLDDAISIAKNKATKDSIMNLSQTVNTTKSFTISGAKVNIKSKKPQLYDPANVTVSYAYTESNQHSPEIENQLDKDQKLNVGYTYSFGNSNFEPFKRSKTLSSPVLKIIKDFNVNLLPSSISFNSNMSRQVSLVKLRELTSTEDVVGTTVSSQFLWNRQFDIKYDLTKSLKLSFQTAMNSNIAEPQLVPEIGQGYYEHWRDSVWSNIKKLGTPYTYQQVFNASWNVPVNKLPYMDWITANVSYNSTYNWNLVATTTDENGDVVGGNTATSLRVYQGDAQLNFETFYNKIKYLKAVNKRFSSVNIQNKMDLQPKSYTTKLIFDKNKTVAVTHRLNSEKVKLTAMDKYGKQVQLKYKIKNNNTIEINSTGKKDTLSLTVAADVVTNYSLPRNIVDFTARALMMVRRASVSYRQSNSLVMTGLLSSPGLLGQGTTNGVRSPGYAFTFGLFDDNTISKMKDKGLLFVDEDYDNPATTAYTSNLSMKATLEPITGLKIDLDAQRYVAKNTSIHYMYDGMPTTYTGSYNMTIVALSTAFKKIGSANDNYSSATFDKMLSYRSIIAERLNNKYAGRNYPSTGFFSTTDAKGLAGSTFSTTNGAFTESSSDVLLSSFIAAYTGQSPDKIETTPFLSIFKMFPNWRVSYDGLSNIGFIHEKVKSITLTHAYSCKYSVGSYTSYSSWVGLNGDNNFGFITDVTDASRAIPTSLYDISSVSISEQFSPLLGVNVTMKNSVTGKLEFRKQRNLSLSLSSAQLLESTSDEYVVGMGYVLKDFDVILRLKSDKQKKIKNDLKLTCDVSYKDIKSLLRKIEENVTQASSGNKLFTIKVIADYVFSSKLNIQLFYDRQSSTPLVSSSYPVSSSNFGMSFKFTLTR